MNCKKNQDHSPYLCDHLLWNLNKNKLTSNNMIDLYPEFNLFNPGNNPFSWFDNLEDRENVMLFCYEMSK